MIGIYYRSKLLSQDSDKLDHYFVDSDLSMPMTLYLYNSNDDGSIDNVFSWEPATKQWWITGFNPEYVGEVDVHDLTMVGCIDMSDNVSNNKKDVCDQELFEKLKEQYAENKYMYFDEISHMVWILWGE
ncbi:MAG: hypothetical protein LUI06_08785 [Ruminococcus sp.]|nr:hypothetical protein [Ruminococcus sp.]